LYLRLTLKLELYQSMAATKKRATRKKKKSIFNQLSFKFDAKDERVWKIFGLLFVLLSLYLTIAFTSYLFTWEADQDEVLNQSWGILFDTNAVLANWLGRLGAIVSHQFFYMWFGVASYIVVFLCFATGVSWILNRPLSRFYKTFRFAFFSLLWMSLLLAFLFVEPGVITQSHFPWGGAFGEAMSSWLGAFLGQIGMILFLLFTVSVIAIWRFNPNFNELSSERFTYNFKKLTGLDFDKFFGKNKKMKQPEITNEGIVLEEESAAGEGLRPSLERGKPKPIIGRVIKPDGKVIEPEIKDGQLAFSLGDTKREKPKSLGEGAELEIEAPKAEEIVDDGEGIVPPAFDETKKLNVEKDNIDHTEPYDPTLDLPSYESPVLALLRSYDDQKIEIDRAELERNKDQIIETLLNYKIEITKIKATIGPTVTLYEIVPAPGVRISKIKNLEDDIALSLAALGIRIIAPIPGKGTIGIEVPNKNKQIVSLKEVLASEKYKRAKMDLPIALGKTITNEVFVADLAKMPHLLMAGATGQGKSVGINTILMSLLYKKHPSQLKLVLVDPKKVELSLYNKLEKHFLGFLPGEEEGIVTDTTKVVSTLNSLCMEMDDRYELLKKAGARNIREYNEKFTKRRLNPNKGHRFLPFIVLVIDEFADLIMTAGKEVELPIGRLAQLARAIGIHLIIATQRPSVNIITGVIKANFPARMAFKVTSKIDSRTILDGGGADQLIGRGDMLLSVDGKMVRIQCAFVDTPEVEEIIDYIANQNGYSEPYYLPEFGAELDAEGKSGIKIEDLDSLFVDAARTVVQNQLGSTSMIQRRMKLGYNRAGRIMDQMESLGIVGPSEGSKAREVLIYDEMELEKYLKQLGLKM